MDLLRDIRFAGRLLVKNRWFTVMAVVVLALGIGANNAVFTIVNGVLLRNLPVPEPEEIIPALLPVTVRLTTPSTEGNAVGTLIEGEIEGAVRRNGKIVLADGAVVRGRIRRLQRFENGRHFIVGLEFTEVEGNGGPQRFYADLLSIDKRPGFRPTLSRRIFVRGASVGSGYGPATEEITLHELPGVASFFVEGTTLAIPSGFRTFWRTRGLIR